MRPRITDHVMDLLTNPQHGSAEFTFLPEEEPVADWLRGDEAKLRSLLRMLMARIEGRAKLPSSSTQGDAMSYNKDRETREIMDRLVELCSAPVYSGSDEEENG